MQDIILNGISINELKRTKAALQKDATKFISDAITQVQQIVKERLVTADNYGEAEAAAQEALTLLENAKVVSDASGVSFFLPYYEEYGGSDDEDILSSLIENADEDIIGSYYGGGTLSALYNLLESMESESRDWHSSTC
jgi:hypothetical protein